MRRFTALGVGSLLLTAIALSATPVRGGEEIPSAPPPGEALGAEAAADPKTELARGEVLLSLGLPDEAARSFRRVLMTEPDSVRIWERLRRATIVTRMRFRWDDRR